MLNRTREGTWVTGCKYSSSRNISLTEYAFVKFGGRAIKLYSNNEGDLNSSHNNVYPFPDFLLKEVMESGEVSCAVQIGVELFSSNTSFLYGKPGNCLKYREWNIHQW